MPALLHSSRVDLLELKAQIVRKIGYKRSEKYFCHLKAFLSNKIIKSKFDRICSNTIGRENIILHNNLIQSIIKNACFAGSPPAYTTKSVNSVNRSQGNHSSICTDAIPWSPRKSRSANIRDRKFSDRPSPLKPVDKVPMTLKDYKSSRVKFSLWKMEKR
ncbi:hypothetical protein H6P81_020426 [Aristolochia fimbriata]|uniref:Uncharacterized protein n=1 Tax=Aristolochia fimbriata TaxID=158543 RepID=A0AAV7DXN7_ARIFI|nr:hypothetical protein H6P81_020426 [Aristolochia fimbriata]